MTKPETLETGRDWWKELLAWRKGAVWPEESFERLATADMDGAYAVARRYRSILSWTSSAGWRVWNGRVHAPDGAGSVGGIGRAYADAYDDAMRRLLLEVDAPADFEKVKSISEGIPPDKAEKRYEERRKQYLGWLRKHLAYRDRLRMDAGQKGLLSQLGSVCEVDEADFDSGCCTLSVGNGVIDLEVVRRGGRIEVLPHDPARMITRGTSVPYMPDAECKQFDAFLAAALPDDELRWWLCCALGSALLGEPRHKSLVNLIGPRNTGKSVVLHVVRRVLGGYAWVAPVDALLRGGSTFDLNDFRGARLVTVSETPEDGRLNDAAVKQLTGGVDEVNSRGLYKSGRVWSPECLLVVATNHPVRFSTGDEALLKRLRRVPFEHQIPVSEVDLGLAERIVREESAGVLAWLVRGMLGYLEKGLPDLPVMVQRREEMAEEITPALQFMRWAIEDAQVIVPNVDSRPAFQCAHVTDLFQLYRKWCRGPGGVDRPVGSKTFTQQVCRKYVDQVSGGRRLVDFVPSIRWEQRDYWTESGGPPSWLPR